MNTFTFSKKQKSYLVLKRLIAICGSFVGIILCALLLWWWVFIINIFATKGHPIFVHRRIGKNKKVFKLLKFRSMKVNANPNLAPSDMSVQTQANMDTWFGPFLRKTSIDETLQLINIFIGQMSFIGPRPGAAKNEQLLIDLRDSYDPSAFMVKPGLGGYAQMMMNRSHDPKLKAMYDSEYVKKISLKLDIKVFMSTLLGIHGKQKGR